MPLPVRMMRSADKTPLRQLRIDRGIGPAYYCLSPRLTRLFAMLYALPAAHMSELRRRGAVGSFYATTMKAMTLIAARSHLRSVPAHNINMGDAISREVMPWPRAREDVAALRPMSPAIGTATKKYMPGGRLLGAFMAHAAHYHAFFCLTPRASRFIILLPFIYI